MDKLPQICEGTTKHVINLDYENVGGDFSSCFNLVPKPGADQCSSDRRGADFPGRVHWCASKGADRAVVFFLGILP